MGRSDRIPRTDLDVLWHLKHHNDILDCTNFSCAAPPGFWQQRGTLQLSQSSLVYGWPSAQLQQWLRAQTSQHLPIKQQVLTLAAITATPFVEWRLSISVIYLPNTANCLGHELPSAFFFSNNRLICKLPGRVPLWLLWKWIITATSDADVGTRQGRVIPFQETLLFVESYINSAPRNIITRGQSRTFGFQLENLWNKHHGTSFVR